LLDTFAGAAWRGHRKVVKLLIAKGADLEAKDKDGSTPLHIAAQCGHRKVVELLLQKGADIEAKVKMAALHCIVLLC